MGWSSRLVSTIVRNSIGIHRAFLRAYKSYKNGLLGADFSSMVDSKNGGGEIRNVHFCSHFSLKKMKQKKQDVFMQFLKGFKGESGSTWSCLRRGHSGALQWARRAGRAYRLIDTMAES